MILPMIPLVVRSHFSLMRGTASPEALAIAAKKTGYKRLAITDTDNLYGLWYFVKACKQEGIEPIIGAEMTDPAKPRKAVCLVKNESGFKNLCRLISKRKCDAGFELDAALTGHKDGLYFLASDEWLLASLKDAGASVASLLSCKPNGESFKTYKAAKRLGLKAVAAPDSYMLRPEEFNLHKILRAINLNASPSRVSPKDTAPSDAYLTAPEEYAKRFEIWPETVKNSWEIAESLEFTNPRLGLAMPPYKNRSSKDTLAELRQKTYDGARKRYGDELSETVIERIEYELKVIGEMGFASYFLVVEDIVKRSPRICGRGSGAASIVAYNLGITNVCPIKYNLYFERFLNPGRKDPPDIDVDFAWDERDDVINSVLEQYKGHSAMVCNHVFFQPRMAIREVAKVYGLTEAEIGHVSKKLPWFWRSNETDDDLLERLKTLPELKQLDFPEPWPEIIKIAQSLIGIPRMLSVHPGGVVITQNPLDEYAPVEIAPKGVPIIQWEKDGAEDAGLVKIDLLGNRSLAVIRDAIANAKANGIDFNETAWEPESDLATIERIAAGETMGCFYIESPATRLLQQKSNVGDYERMVIHTSIIRPAANRYINEYLKRLKGEPWAPIHPLMEGVLDETYGIMVYQEDVSKTAVALAGFSHVDADGLRKVMSKKDRNKRLPDYFRRFREGAKLRGVADEQIKEIWEMILSFDGYSFCKPHSASYIRVSFQSSYLKTHFPAEFMAAVISNQGGFYSPFAYVSEARRLGLKVLPPDVNESEYRWKGRRDRLRVGFLSVKELGKKTAEHIIAERAKKEYQNISDFLERIKPEENETKALVYCRAFERLHPSESIASLLWEAASWHKKRLNVKTASGDLFAVNYKTNKPSFGEDDKLERLRREYSTLGFLCDFHPIILFEQTFINQRIIKAKELRKYTGKKVRVAGFLITAKVVSTKDGDPMEFITFEDETGIIETTFFPLVYRRFCSELDYFQPYILAGKIEESFGAVTLTVESVEKVSNRGLNSRSRR